MIALDTNILVRYFVEDDAAQTELARGLIEERLTHDRPGFVSIVTIVELAWVLEDVYGVAVAGVRGIVAKLLDSAQIAVEQPDVVASAIRLPHRDLSDALIHEIGRASGCNETLTFDRHFARLSGVKLLA